MIILLALIMFFSPQITCRVLSDQEKSLATSERDRLNDVWLRCNEAGEITYKIIPRDEYLWQGCENADILIERDAEGHAFFGKQNEGCKITKIAKLPKCTPAELAQIECGERLPLGAIPCKP